MHEYIGRQGLLWLHTHGICPGCMPVFLQASLGRGSSSPRVEGRGWYRCGFSSAPRHHTWRCSRTTLTTRCTSRRLLKKDGDYHHNHHDYNHHHHHHHHHHNHHYHYSHLHRHDRYPPPHHHNHHHRHHYRNMMMMMIIIIIIIIIINTVTCHYN